ncbi:hypothetical protein AA0119_g13442 [Alternaria tenuissima]|uniref:Azaphilone pigments biosynthesis cluster protein L N-terminal domain-containing protein n=1 Tax=Alternaria tenuissima TaxID=119927 RepID=A0ABY0FNM4_9PLEO|nr:hypothetical protein AA0119_g13442 [Alternaria tenuissima]RYO00276.1 hypothetical protein AA0121_g13410 [Alternaria tenuissima]
MDPLSITASITGITTAAFQSVQFLAKTIDNVKDAPNTVRSVSTDLQAVEPVLQNLEKALQDGTSQIVLSNEIKYAVDNCDRACRAFQSQVEHWMKHSTEDKMFWMDRWKIGLFGLERIKTFRGQLSDCKGTLSMALSTATILTTSRNGNLMKEIKDMMLQQNEAVVQQQIIRADTETAQIERSMQQLASSRGGELSSVPQQTSESEQSRQELLQELERQQAANNAFKAMCEEALSKTVYERTGQKIKGVKATNNSSAITGFINTSGEEERIEQDISDIGADNWSIAVAGVIKNVDFKDLRPGGADGGDRDDVRRKL